LEDILGVEKLSRSVKYLGYKVALGFKHWFEVEIILFNFSISGQGASGFT
jgi:hypothetical protein